MSKQKAISYQDLKVWQKSMMLAEIRYQMTSYFPRAETFGLTSQIRRSAVSIPSNIAEGYGRGTHATYLHFLRVAQGSLKELETQVLLSGRLNFVNERLLSDTLELCTEIGKMLTAMIKHFERLSNSKIKE